MRLASIGAFPFDELDFFLSIDIYEWYEELFITYLAETGLIDNKEFNIKYNWETLEVYLYRKKDNKLVQTIKVYFEKQIEEHLNKIILDSVKLIHTTIEKLLLSNQDYISYLKQIECQYENLFQYDSIKKFPFLINYFQNIKDEIEKIEQKYSINLSEKIVKKSSYTLKGDVRPNIFSEIYTFCSENEIIDGQEIEQETFTSVFKDRETSETIQFTCSTSLAVGVLETIKELFNNFTAKTVEKSQRFYTKDGNLLKQSNYNKAKKEIKSKDQEILTTFLSEFKESFN